MHSDGPPAASGAVEQATDSAVYSVPAADRPLVQVFIVQESMELDALQSVSHLSTSHLWNLPFGSNGY